VVAVWPVVDAVLEFVVVVVVVVVIGSDVMLNNFWPWVNHVEVRVVAFLLVVIALLVVYFELSSQSSNVIYG
jgi:hypothetical protein